MYRDLAILAVICGCATSTAAGEFDGVYRQSNTADCTLMGVDNGALLIRDETFFGVGSECRMQNPVNVRDMDAILFDMQCGGEGQYWTERALLMHAADEGLIMVWNGYAFHYDRCNESDIVDSALTAQDQARQSRDDTPPQTE